MGRVRIRMGSWTVPGCQAYRMKISKGLTSARKDPGVAQRGGVGAAPYSTERHCSMGYLQ